MNVNLLIENRPNIINALMYDPSKAFDDARARGVLSRQNYSDMKEPWVAGGPSKGEVDGPRREVKPVQDGKTKHQDFGNEEHPDKDSNPKNAEADLVAENLGLQDVTKDDLGDLTSVGRGGFGEVFKATHNKWQNMVAVKMMQGSDWKKEVNNLMKAQYVYTVQILGLYKDSGTISGLVLEWMSQGSVEGFNEKVDAGWALRLRLLHEIALGMNYLHCMEPKHLLHLDLKPANVLLNEHLNTKIADFGLGEVHHTTSTVILKESDPIGTLPYMAPERLDINEKQSRKWDVYSYALVIWAVMARSEPYEDVEKWRIQWLIKAPQHQRPRIPKEATPYPDLIALVKKCWDKDPKVRPFFDECAKRMKMMQKGKDEIKQDVDKALSDLHVEASARCSKNGKSSTRRLLPNTLDTDLVSLRTGEVTTILEEIPGASGSSSEDMPSKCAGTLYTKTGLAIQPHTSIAAREAFVKHRHVDCTVSFGGRHQKVRSAVQPASSESPESIQSPLSHHHHIVSNEVDADDANNDSIPSPLRDAITGVIHKLKGFSPRLQHKYLPASPRSSSQAHTSLAETAVVVATSSVQVGNGGHESDTLCFMRSDSPTPLLLECSHKESEDRIEVQEALKEPSLSSVSPHQGEANGSTLLEHHQMVSPLGLLDVNCSPKLVHKVVKHFKSLSTPHLFIKCPPPLASLSSQTSLPNLSNPSINRTLQLRNQHILKINHQEGKSHVVNHLNVKQNSPGTSRRTDSADHRGTNEEKSKDNSTVSDRRISWNIELLGNGTAEHLSRGSRDTVVGLNDHHLPNIDGSCKQAKTNTGVDCYHENQSVSDFGMNRFNPLGMGTNYIQDNMDPSSANQSDGDPTFSGKIPPWVFTETNGEHFRDQAETLTYSADSERADNSTRPNVVTTINSGRNKCAAWMRSNCEGSVCDATTNFSSADCRDREGYGNVKQGLSSDATPEQVLHIVDCKKVSDKSVEESLRKFEEEIAETRTLPVDERVEDVQLLPTTGLTTNHENIEDQSCEIMDAEHVEESEPISDQPHGNTPDVSSSSKPTSIRKLLREGEQARRAVNADHEYFEEKQLCDANWKEEELSSERCVEEIQLFKQENETFGLDLELKPSPTRVFIKSIQPGGITEKAGNGRLRNGDEILAVNGVRLGDLPVTEILNILCCLPNHLHLTVHHPLMDEKKDISLTIALEHDMAGPTDEGFVPSNKDCNGVHSSTRTDEAVCCGGKISINVF